MTAPTPRRKRREPIDARLVGAASALVIVAMLGWFLHVGRDLLVPIVASVLCVFAISGLSAVLAKVSWLRTLPGWVRDLIAAGLICLALVELTILMVTNLGAMVAQAPAYQAALADLVVSAASMMGLDGEQTLRAVQTELAGALDLSELLRASLASAVAALAVLIFVLLNIAFLMLERKDFDSKLDRLGLDTKGLSWLRAILDDINTRVGQYLAVQTLINVVLGFISWLVMKAFGMEFAVVFAVIIAVLNYIPYVGSFVAVAFPVAAGVVEFENPGTTIWLAIALTLVQFAIGNVMQPRVMGTSLNLSPWVILVGLTFWTSMWGVAGAVFAVPIMAVAVVILSEFESTRAAAVMISQKGILPPSAGAKSPDGEAKSL